MDEFKKYIQEHTDKFDLDEPAPRVWENIKAQTKPVKKAGVVLMVTRFAAAACILALAGIGVWHLFSNTGTVPVQPIALVEKAKPQPQPSVTGNEPAITEKTVAATVKTASTNKNTKHQVINSRPSSNQEALNNLVNIENSFTQVINLQRDRVNSMPMYAESPEYFKDFKIQIRQMEKDEKVIKSDIAKRGMNDVLLDQLINLYQQKLNTLKQLQIEMNKTNTRYKQNRGPVDSARTYFINL